MNNSLLFILVLGISLSLALIGIALRIMRLEQEKKAADSATPPVDLATPPTASTTPTPQPAAPSKAAVPLDPQLPELARLMHAPDGAFVVEINGRRYRHRNEITDARAGKQLLAAVAELQKFLRGETPPPTTAETGAPFIEPPPPPPAEIKLSAREAAQMPIEKPSMNVFRQWQTLREREKQPAVKIKSILDEIDEILQRRIAGTPLAARRLRVYANPSGTTVFSIDGNAYESVELLPDEAARAAMAAAIAEWEKSA